MAQCPDEAELLAYAEKRLSLNRRSALEAHLAYCDGCRESLVLFAHISDEEIRDVEALDFENIEALDMSMSSELIHRQTEKVLSFIERDEAEHVASELRQERIKEDRVSQGWSGFFVSYTQLAVAATLVIVAAVAIGYLLTNPRKALADGIKAYAAAIKDNRRIDARTSGGFNYSRNSVTRGDGKNDERKFELAISKLEFAEEESAPAEARLALARVYLSRDKPGDAEKALNILSSISNTDDATPELLNDTGVALYLIEDYPKAIEAFSKALEKNPDYEEALFNRALANAGADFNNAARNDFARFIDVTNDEKWKQEAEERKNKLP